MNSGNWKVETERLLFISGPRSLVRLCEACGNEVRLVTVDVAAAMARLTSLEVYRSVEAGKLHHAETTAGALLICGLARRLNLKPERMKDMTTRSGFGVANPLTYDSFIHRNPPVYTGVQGANHETTKIADDCRVRANLFCRGSGPDQ